MQKFDYWNKKVMEYQKEKTMRKGQAWMNALGDVDLALYHEWSGKPWDCFYDDSKCDAFMEKLMQEWSA